MKFKDTYLNLSPLLPEKLEKDKLFFKKRHYRGNDTRILFIPNLESSSAVSHFAPCLKNSGAFKRLPESDCWVLVYLSRHILFAAATSTRKAEKDNEAASWAAIFDPILSLYSYTIPTTT